MEPLDEFRQSWRNELHQDEIQTESDNTDDLHQPNGDLCRLGIDSKRSLDHFDDESIPESTVDPSTSLSSLNSTSTSFTIGIRQFNVAKTSTNFSKTEQKQKKLKTSSETSLIDQLIRDIDESTDVPFFNLSLPREIALKIFYYLSMKDLSSCLRVCRSWNWLSSDELLWQNVYKNLKFRSRLKIESASWKDHVKDVILFGQEIRRNFRNHQCRTTKLTYYLGRVLTCASTDSTNIVAGYSNGVIRSWSIQSIIDAEQKFDDDQFYNQTADIIYDSTNLNPNSDLSSVRSVGILDKNLYAIHDDGFLEVWRRETGKKAHFTQKLNFSSIDQVADDRHSKICVSTGLKFHVWDVSKEQHQIFDIFLDHNDSFISFAISSDHGVPISILSGRKSLWCVSLNDLTNRYAFYSFLSLDFTPTVNLDIRSDEPIAAISFDRQIKLFDLQCGRCNILSNDYRWLPAEIRLIRANQCPKNEFIAAFDNYQISIFDQRQKQGAVQHFYGHHGPISSLQMDSWKVASADRHGFVRLWDRRMNPQSLWSINPQSHPVTYCSFDEQTLIFASTPTCKYVDANEYEINPNIFSGHIYLCDFNGKVSTELDDDLQICTSTYDAPKASTQHLDLFTPYDAIG